MPPNQSAFLRKVPRSLIAPAIFLGLTLIVLHWGLFQTGNQVLSSPGGDMVAQFIPWREFGFGQWRHGNFPLWNPYIYGGAPYFAGFQSALLYPPNWLHLILPVATAINWIIALQLFAAGYFVYLWCRERGASIAGSLLGGIMFMLCGPYFLHIYAGHLANLAVMVWAPLLFLAIDKLNQTGALHWCLLGTLAVTLQILGGHPQYLYYTGIISFLYTAMAMRRSKHRGALAVGYVICFAAACLLAAVQLLAGFQAAGESVRSGGTDFSFASMFALPPENLFTFLTPGIFGKLPLPSDPADATTYFGRCYLWEMSVYVSISGLVLACIGAIVAWRRTMLLSAVILITLLLALGKHLPLYALLYNYLPEYASFRSVSKFSFLTALFLCPLAAAGFDLLPTSPRAIKAAAIATGAMAILLGLLALAVFNDGFVGAWAQMLGIIGNSQESYVDPAQYQQPAFIKATQLLAAHSIGWAAATLAAICLIFSAIRLRPQAAYLLIVLAGVELAAFALSNVATTDPECKYPPPWLAAIRAEPGDFRVVNGALPHGQEGDYLDVGMSLGIANLWGYDPGVLKRYAETLFASQGINPDHASQYLSIQRIETGIFQMLRCRLGLTVSGGRATALQLFNPLPVAQLVPNWVVRPSRDEVLTALLANDFDPRKTVVLESSPGITPSEDAVAGPAEVVNSSTDWVEIRTTTPAPTMLLITDNFSTGWRVVPLETTSQSSYRILPANRTLMAIPLQAGTHHLRIEYLPTAYRVGKWISIIALVFYVLIFAAWLLRGRIPAPPHTSGNLPPEMAQV